jgi:hypothetical protein
VREAIARANGSEAKKAALAAFPPDQVSARVRAMTPAAADLAVRLAKAQDAAERAQNAADLLEAELLCAIGKEETLRATRAVDREAADRGIEGTHAGKHYRAIWGAKTPGATRSLTFTVS